MITIFNFYAFIAQLGERLSVEQEVGGSKPPGRAKFNGSWDCMVWSSACHAESQRGSLPLRVANYRSEVILQRKRQRRRDHSGETGAKFSNKSLLSLSEHGVRD